MFANARPLIAEVLEREGRAEEAISFAQAEVADAYCWAAPSKARAGRVLGRVHAKRGQHSLSAAALDAAIELARDGQYVMQEALGVSGRAAAGLAAGGAGVHWTDYTGKQRLAEVARRMQGDAGALVEALAAEGRG